MAKENVKALCLRFDLDDEDERRAYDYLQNRNRQSLVLTPSSSLGRSTSSLNEGQDLKQTHILKQEKKKMLLLRGCLRRCGMLHPLSLQVKKQMRRNKMRMWRQCSLFLTASDDSKSSAFAITILKNAFKYAIKNTKFYITEEFTEC